MFHNNTDRSTTSGSSMHSLIRPRTSSPKSPAIRHARALSPRSVMFEYHEEDSSAVGAQHLPHLQQPCHNDLTYDDSFCDWKINKTNNDTNTYASTQKPYAAHGPTLAMSSERNTCRTNKRKLFSSELPPRCSLNLRHRQVSDETVAWLCGKSNSLHCGTKHILSDSEYGYGDVFISTPLHLAARDHEEGGSSRTSAAASHSTREPPMVEELWLGPVFESSHTVLSAISTLPESVHHLDLDLRNALHLLPEAMPLLFAKGHLRTLSLRLFGDAGAMELAKWIGNNPNLEQLDLRGNRIGSLGAQTIVDAIINGGDNKNNALNLTHLNLSCNCILHGDLFESLLVSNSTIRSLDLGFNWLGNKEVEDICRGLRKNTSLRELILFGCHRISHSGMRAILECLQKYNTSLHEMKLQCFDEEGRKIIEEINHWLKLNKAGRYLVKSSLPSSITSASIKQSCGNSTSTSCQDYVPISIWPQALEKSSMDADSLFYLVREGLSPRIGNFR